MKVSVFGLGIIGALWTRHYEADGLLAAAWNRSAKPDLPRWQADALTAAQQGDLLHLVVADPAAVGQVLDAVMPGLGPGKVVVQSSTIDPSSADRFCNQVKATGAAYVEAPFTGSKPAAEQRAIIAFLGGETPALDLVEPILSRISAKRIRVGLPQHAAALKLSMNLQIAIVTEALAEGLAFARGSGISDDIFFEVLTSNPACSGLVALKGAKLRSADFSPQFAVKHLLKDLRLVIDIPTAKRLPATTLLAEQLQLLMNEGGADEDFSALFKLFKSKPISPQ
jgi:3-hydroxyisobutyrate dehydrogenase-like beta-hydroxyacid dehydrogenase